MVSDPVCGMTVNPDNSFAVSIHEDQMYYFCSLACKSLFDCEPEKYVGNTKPAEKEEYK
jgi:Cu+-exporting ATPase